MIKKSILLVIKFLFKIFQKYRKFIVSIKNKLQLLRFNVVYGNNLQINGEISISSNGNLTIGNDCTLNSGIYYNPIGGDIITRLIVKNSGTLSIGNNVGISNSTIYSTNSIVIKDNVLIGGGTKVWDTDFHSIDPIVRMCDGDNEINSKPIIIEEFAFIGGNSIVLKGVTIGKNSIIGAGSVVSGNIPPNEIWAGNPAKFIKKIDIKE